MLLEAKNVSKAFGNFRAVAGEEWGGKLFLAANP